MFIELKNLLWGYNNPISINSDYIISISCKKYENDSISQKFRIRFLTKKDKEFIELYTTKEEMLKRYEELVYLLTGACKEIKDIT